MRELVHQSTILFRLALYFSILISIFATLCSCSPSTSEAQSTEPYGFSKINCYVRYMAQTRELQAEITFRTDSTTGISGEVLFNNEPMIFKKLPMVGFQYRLLKNTPTFDNKHTFSYTERDGSQVNMEIEMAKFENFHLASDGISREVGGLMQWEGEALGEQDGLVLIFTDSKGNTFTVNHSGISRGSQFELMADYSNRLELGKATVQTVRKKTILIKETNTIKMLTLEYYLGSIEFDVKK